MYSYYYPSYYNPYKTGMQEATQGMQPQGMQGEMDGGIAGPGSTAGMPTIPAAPPTPTIQPPPVDFAQEPGPPVTTDIGYTQAYLRTQIGRRVRVEFLIGTNILTDRIGILTDVGISYIILKPVGTDDRLLCDIYSIKFVTIIA